MAAELNAAICPARPNPSLEPQFEICVFAGRAEEFIPWDRLLQSACDDGTLLDPEIPEISFPAT
jgi:hypothetical protein